MLGPATDLLGQGRRMGMLHAQFPEAPYMKVKRHGGASADTYHVARAVPELAGAAAAGPEAFTAVCRISFSRARPSPS